MNTRQITFIAIGAVVVGAIGLVAAYNQLVIAPTPPSLATGKESPLIVATSVAPIANIIKNVGGDKVQILQFIPDGIDSHTFKLSATDGVIVKTKANIVVINGLNLEVAIEEAAIQSQNSKLTTIKLADKTISHDEWIFDNSFPEENGNPNPHLWLNVVYAEKYAEIIRDGLSTVDPENAEYYDLNTDRYLDRLHQLDAAIMDSIQTIPPENRKLVTYHDSWPYFAKHYGLEVVIALQPANFKEPTQEEIAQIIAQTQNERVPAIFASEVFPNDVTEQIASEAHVEVVRTLRDDALPGEPDASQHTYVGMMVANVRTMVSALGGDPSALEEIDPGDTYLSN
jgi:ABC-type Zn uptake system ZnuABC Zn-binding protein ZnuA